MPEFKNLDQLAEYYAGISVLGPIALIALVSSKQTGFVYQLLFQPRYDEQTKFVKVNQMIVQYLHQGVDEYVTVRGEGSRELDKNEVYAKNLFAMIHAAKEINPLADSLLMPIKESFEQTTFRQINSLPPARLAEYPLSDTYRWDLRLTIRALEYATAAESPLAGLQRIVTHHLPERSQPSVLLPMKVAFDSKTVEENLAKTRKNPSDEKPRDSRILITGKMPTKKEIEALTGRANLLVTKK